MTMATWTKNELDSIDRAEELTLASVRADGSLRKPVTMWVVRSGDDIFVRSVNGRGSAWFRGAQTRHLAHIRAGGVEKDVGLVETDEADDEADAAYQAKYGTRYPTIVPSIVAPQSWAATLKLTPHEKEKLMHKRTLGNSLEVSAIGLGCMGMSTGFPPFPPKQEMVSLCPATPAGRASYVDDALRFCD